MEANRGAILEAVLPIQVVQCAQGIDPVFRYSACGERRPYL